MFKATDAEIALARKLYVSPQTPCNCGGPSYGTDHSPDCALVLAEDDAWDDALDDAWEKLEE